jgi:putative tricarboxylic transport membrane protein
MKNPKDFWAGVIYLGMGVATVAIAREYPMGTAVKMGPAYFPTVLGGLLCLIGLVSLIRSFFTSGEAIGAFALKGVSLIAASVVLFGLLARGAGLVPALGVLVVCSAYASIQFRWKSAMLLAAGLIVFCALVFIKLLGVPLPLLGPWLGV